MECDKCRKEYKEDEREPRIVPCGSTLCTVCITENIVHAQLKCPFCHTMHGAAAFTDFPLNDALIKMFRTPPAKRSRSEWKSLDDIRKEDTSQLTQAIENTTIPFNRLKEYSDILTRCSKKQNAHMKSFKKVIQHIESEKVRLKEEQDKVKTILSQGKDIMESMKLENQKLMENDTIEDFIVVRNSSLQRGKQVSDWEKNFEEDLKVKEIITLSEEESMRLALMLKINGSGIKHTSDIAAISSFIDSLQKEHHQQQRHLSEEDEEKYMNEIIENLPKSKIENSQISKSILPIFRYNEIASRFFGQIPRIKEDTIHITDSCVSLYAAIFKTNIPKEVTVEISGKMAKLRNITELFFALRDSRCKVDRLHLHHLYYNPEDIPQNNDIIHIAGDITERCNVRRYVGPVMSNLQNIPDSMEELLVTVPDIDTLQQFQKQLKNTIKPLTFLGIRLSPVIGERELEDIQPLPATHNRLFLLIPDVKTVEDTHHAASLAKRLLPITGNKSLFQLDFPRCQLKEVKDVEGLLQSLNGIKVTGWIRFPESSKPSSETEEERIQDMAKNITGRLRGIIWMKQFNF